MKEVMKRRALITDITSVVVLIIGAVILLAAVYKIYGAVVSNESDIAKKALDFTLKKIQALEDGQNTTFTLKGPEKWVMLGWSKDALDRPQKCFSYYDTGCLCICEKRSECDKNLGFCGRVGKDSVRVYNALSLREDLASYEGEAEAVLLEVKTRAVSKAYCIKFPPTLAELSMNRSVEGVIIVDASEKDRCT